jgi:hypothetical protein
MDGLTLLSEGQAAGLIVIADGDRLVIRGPKSADAVARRLLAHKAVILAVLAAGNGNTTPAIPKVASIVAPHLASIHEVVPFDDLLLPGPACPRCGSLESWTDILGGQHCGVCERATLDKALRLAERAARLRQQAQQRKPAPRIAPGCVAAGRVDMQDLGDKRPTQGELRGFGGV